MKLRNILLIASALPSLIYGSGIDFSSLKPSVPDIQVNSFNETKKASTKKNTLKKNKKPQVIDSEEIALNYLKETYPELEFEVSSVVDTEGFYTTTVNLAQTKHDKKISNAFVNVNIDKRTGFIYNSNISVWGEVAFDEEDELTEKKTQKILKESLIGLNDAFELSKDSSDEWDDIKIIKTTKDQYIINNVPFSPSHSVVAKLVVTVKEEDGMAIGLHAWEFTFFYNGVYNVISYDFKNKKPINGFELRSNIKYVTYPFSKFGKKYDLQEVTDLNNLYFSPNGWHKINDEISTHVTMGNNIKAQDYITQYSFNGGENLEFDGTNCKTTKDCKNKYNKDIALTTMFYVGNMLHDIYYNLGFDEKKGNFQENNFEKGGVGNDAMIILSNIEECTDEERKNDGLCDNIYPFTSCSVDGIPPVIILPKVQNILGEGGGNVSAGVVNHIITHEYTHAVTARLSGGPNFDCGTVPSYTYGDDNAALGEGYSDFFSAALSFDKKKNLTKNTTVVLDNINSGNSISCDNDRKYSDLKIMREKESGYYDGGDFWKVTLYEAFFNIVDNYPSTDDYLQVFEGDDIPGNVVFLKIVLEGLKIAGCNPTFIRARNGIIHAMEKNKYTENDKKFQCLVWKAFADRGLGYNAHEPVIHNGDKFLYSNNHDLPDFCHDELD